MATLQCSAHPSKSILGFHRLNDRADTPSITFLNPILGFHSPNGRADTPLITFLNLRLGHNAPPAHFTFGSKNHARSLLRQRLLHPVYASNGSSEGSDVRKSSEAAKGPPFLTILAGFLVFFAICWIIGSIVMWLIGLIFHVPPSK